MFFQKVVALAALALPLTSARAVINTPCASSSTSSTRSSSSSSTPGLSGYTDVPVPSGYANLPVSISSASEIIQTRPTDIVTSISSSHTSVSPGPSDAPVSSAPIDVVIPSSAPLEVVASSSAFIDVVAPSSAPIEVVASSVSPIEVVVPSPTPVEVVVSLSAVEAVAPSSAPIEVLVSSSAPFEVVVPSATPVEEIISSATPIEVVVPSSVLIEVVLPSSAPVEEVVPSATPVEEIIPSATPIEVVASVSAPVEVVVSSSAPVEVVLPSSAPVPAPTPTPTPADSLPSGCTLVDVPPAPTDVVVGGNFENYVDVVTNPSWQRSDYAYFYNIPGYAQSGNGFVIMWNDYNWDNQDISIYQTLHNVATTDASYTLTFWYQPYYYDYENKSFLAVTLDNIEIARVPISTYSATWIPFKVAGVRSPSANPVLKLKLVNEGEFWMDLGSEVFVDSVSLVKEQVDPVVQVVSCVSQPPPLPTDV